MTFQAQAEVLAATADDLGHAAALVVAQAWAARVEPEAAAGIIAAALALGAGQQEFYQGAERLASGRDMKAAAEILAADAWELLRAAAGLSAGAAATLEAARAEQRSAARREGGAGTPKARDAIAAAGREAADCEAALEIADDLGRRAQVALRRLEQVPDDLETTYDVPYAHVRSGRTLPHSGDFVTGTTEGALA